MYIALFFSFRPFYTACSVNKDAIASNVSIFDVKTGFLKGTKDVLTKFLRYGSRDFAAPISFFSSDSFKTIYKAYVTSRMLLLAEISRQGIESKMTIKCQHSRVFRFDSEQKIRNLERIAKENLLLLKEIVLKEFRWLPRVELNEMAKALEKITRIHRYQIEKLSHFARVLYNYLESLDFIRESIESEYAQFFELYNVKHDESLYLMRKQIDEFKKYYTPYLVERRRERARIRQIKYR